MFWRLIAEFDTSKIDSWPSAVVTCVLIIAVAYIVGKLFG